MKNHFKISQNNGKVFSSLSGDYNKIHIDELEGYNSMFGQNICHGVLVIIKFFEFYRIDLKKIQNLKISFFQPFFYKKKIEIKKKNQKNLISFYLKQDHTIKLEILIEKKKVTFQKSFHSYQRLKKIFVTTKLKKKFGNLDNNFSKLCIMLCLLTKYAGTYFPGNSSIITNININFLPKSKKQIKNFALIKSRYRDKRLPIIQNYLKFRDLEVNFETIERSPLTIKLKRPSNNLKNMIKKLRAKIFILGASSGIGNDILKLLGINKKIKIFATYFKNSINFSSKNVKKIKFDIRKNKEFDQLLRIINKQKENQIYIYYFCTPKINLKKIDREKIKEYHNYYLKYPLSILRKIKNKKINFFYPSTDFINQKSDSIYAKEKLNAEKILMRKKPKSVDLRICRIPKINTKQNLEFLSGNYPNFRDLLKKDYYLKSFLFN